MTEQDKLIIQNVLNGCGMDAVAIANNTSPEKIGALMAEVKQVVAEFIATGRTTFFSCATLADLQANKQRVMSILEDLDRWDNLDKPALLDLFRGIPSAAILNKYGCTREHLENILDDVMLRIAAYLQGDDVERYRQNKTSWIKQNEYKVTAILERFTSWRAGQQLKNIRFTEQAAGQE